MCLSMRRQGAANLRFMRWRFQVSLADKVFQDAYPIDLNADYIAARE
jgi:hypothetical protein